MRLRKRHSTEKALKVHTEIKQTGKEIQYYLKQSEKAIPEEERVPGSWGVAMASPYGHNLPLGLDVMRWVLLGRSLTQAVEALRQALRWAPCHLALLEPRLLARHR